MDTHRREKHPREKDRLTEEQIAKLDRLAELAKRFPSVRTVIATELETEDDRRRTAKPPC